LASTDLTVGGGIALDWNWGREVKKKRIHRTDFEGIDRIFCHVRPDANRWCSTPGSWNDATPEFRIRADYIILDPQDFRDASDSLGDSPGKVAYAIYDGDRVLETVRIPPKDRIVITAEWVVRNCERIAWDDPDLARAHPG
jgi:hypothetical protein